MVQSKPQINRQTYSLSAVFLLVELAAVLVALATSAPTGGGGLSVSFTDRLLAVTLGMICCGLLGALVGLYHYRRVRGLVWGIVTGTLVGAAIGPTFQVTDYTRVTLLCLGGSVLLITFGLLSRVLLRSSTETS